MHPHEEEIEEVRRHESICFTAASILLIGVGWALMLRGVIAFCQDIF